MGNRKPGSRALAQVEKAKYHQKRRHGTVDASTVVAAAPRARKRARSTRQKDVVEVLVQAADIATQQNVDQWSDRGIPFETLRDEIDPKCADELALVAAALRNGTDLAKFREQVARSRRRVERDKARRAAVAADRLARGFSKTYSSIDGGKRKIVRTGPQVRATRERQRELEAMPVEQRPTYVSQRTSGHGMRSRAGGSRYGPAYVRPEGVRSRAEIFAQAQAKLYVTGPDARAEYRMRIPSSLWSDKALAKMGGRKLKRCYWFKGPTAEADAKAFARTMMEWLEKWKKGVGPPPQPRKP